MSEWEVDGNTPPASGGRRVPLIVRWPGEVLQSSLVDQLLRLNDCYATFRELLADPTESRNLCLAPHDVVERLTALLDRYRAEGRSTPLRPMCSSTMGHPGY